MGIAAHLGRIRRWLKEVLFVDPPSPARRTVGRALLFTGLTVVSFGVQLGRMWSSRPLNSIWAEDGYIWLQDAIHRGFAHSVALPYNGYLQTSSRVIAQVVAILPPAWFAPVMAIAGMTVVTGCAWIVWWATAAFIENRFLRGTLAAMVVLLPNVGTESLDNVTNSIWFALFVTFWMLLWRPSRFGRACGAGFLLAIFALSNGGALILIPVWLLRAVAVRDRTDVAMVAGFGGGIILQLAGSWSALNSLGDGGGESGAAKLLYHGSWHWSLLTAYIQRIVGGALGGQSITARLWIDAGTAFELALLLALAGLVVWLFLIWDPRTGVVVLLAMAMSMLVFLISGYRRWGSAGFAFLWPPGRANTSGSHYMIVPTLLLLSALIVLLDKQLRSQRSDARMQWPKVCAVLLIVVALTTFDVSDRAVRGSPTWSSSLQAAMKRCSRTHSQFAVVPVNPTIPPFVVTVSVPCAG